MSLATRCVHCHTAFKVVQDQLKVSNGWVRCGHCHEIFNALEEMFDTEQQSVWSPSMLSDDFEITQDDLQAPAKPSPAPSAATAGSNTAGPDFDLEFPPIEDAALTDTPSEAKQDTSPQETASAPEVQDEAPATSEPIPHSLPPANDAPSPPLAAALPSGANRVVVPPPTTSPQVLEQSLPPPSQRPGRPGTRGRAPQTPQLAPNFVKQAERQAIWRHPVMRLVLVLVGLLLLGLLALQAAYHWRNMLAAHWPASQPWLQTGCQWLGCTLAAPQDLDALGVDSVTLVKSNTLGNDQYQLTVTLDNRGRIPLAWPTLDLTLTDSNGNVLTRRHLQVTAAHQVPVTDDHNRPSVHLSPVPPTAAPGLTALQWQLGAPDLALASYTAELFYP